MNLNFGNSRSCYDRNSWFSLMKKEEKITFQGSILPKFESYRDFRRIFPDEQSCVNYLEAFIHKGKIPTSPFDPDSKVYECADKKIITKKYSVKYKSF